MSEAGDLKGKESLRAACRLWEAVKEQQSEPVRFFTAFVVLLPVALLIRWLS